MSFNSDSGGLVLSIKDVKIMSSTSTWNTRLSQIGKTKGKLIICTYSLPDIEYIKQILNKKHDKYVYLIAHKKFINKIEQIHYLYPAINIFSRDDVHAKIVLIEPSTVWLSSANFGRSNWFEHTIGFHNKKAYQFYKNEISCFTGIDFEAI